MGSTAVWKPSCQMSRQPAGLTSSGCFSCQSLSSHNPSQNHTSMLAHAYMTPVYTEGRLLNLSQFYCHFSRCVFLQPSFTHSHYFCNKHTHSLTVFHHSTLPDRERRQRRWKFLKQTPFFTHWTEQFSVSWFLFVCVLIYPIWYFSGTHYPSSLLLSMRLVLAKDFLSEPIHLSGNT